MVWLGITETGYSKGYPKHCLAIHRICTTEKYSYDMQYFVDNIITKQSIWRWFI